MSRRTHKQLITVLGGASAASFGSGPAPAGQHWVFVTYNGVGVTYNGSPVVVLVANGVN